MLPCMYLPSIIDVGRPRFVVLLARVLADSDSDPVQEPLDVTVTCAMPFAMYVSV